jgi:hypothetical protein
MNRKLLLMSAFLLMLYIGPSILAMTSTSLPILAGPNMTKDFSPSYDSEYTASDQSINSFSETLPDDVLFYPDAFTNLTEIHGTSGDDDYANSFLLDSVYWETSDVEDANFLVSSVTIEGFTYHCYGQEYLGDTSGARLQYYDGSDWVTLETFTTSFAWYNDTVEGLYTTDTVQLRITVVGYDTSIQVDFLSISVIYMTLASSGYAESFADVSDWAGAGAIASDGDLGYWNIPNDLSYPIVYTNSPSFANAQNLYLELSMKSNYSNIGGRVLLYKADALGGGLLWQTDYFYAGTSGIIMKWIIPASGALESLQLRFQSNGPARAYIDYLRISPANDTGWQHDFSSATGITPSAGDTATSDGDQITLTSDSDGATYEIVIDQTATPANLSTAYYPFLSLNCTSVSAGDGWKLEQYDGANWAFLKPDDFDMPTYAPSVGVYHYNMKPLDTYVEKFRITLTQTAVITFDFMKAYSIANFTYTGTGTSLDDVLYVSADTLYCSATSITSMILDHDPALSVDTSINIRWSIVTSSGTPQTDFYIDGAWVGYSSDTEGDLAAGTLTDVRVKFTDSANIAEINFLYIAPQWYLVGSAILQFAMPFDMWALNMFLILLGMILVPTSTGYLVYGGKNSFSTDKLLYGLFAFMMGWALIIGGIFA